MKKILAICMMFCLLTTAAMAQGMEPATAGVEIPQDVKVEADLNGDGRNEEVLLKMEGADGEEVLKLYVFSADGGVESRTMYVYRMMGAFVSDLDGDGVQEIMVSGDIMSDDYCTYAFQYSDEAGLRQLQFTNVERGSVAEGFADYGYGMVTNVENGQLTLTGSQDVLGTWMCSRVFALKDGKFETVDDGLFRMLDLTEDEDTWEYRALVPTQPISVQFLDGSEGSIETGEAFLVTASDKESIVYFETKTGKTGSFEIQPDTQNGWGSLIAGRSENDYFEFVPYAD